MPRNIAKLTTSGQSGAQPNTLARRDQLAVLTALAAVTVIAWVYLLYDAARMQAMSSGDPVIMMAMSKRPVMPTWTDGPSARYAQC